MLFRLLFVVLAQIQQIFFVRSLQFFVQTLPQCYIPSSLHFENGNLSHTIPGFYFLLKKNAQKQKGLRVMLHNRIEDHVAQSKLFVLSSRQDGLSRRQLVDTKC